MSQAGILNIAGGGGSVISTITGNTGGAESPLASNFNIVGTGSIAVAGSAHTETVSLTGLTNHAVQVGAGTATLTQLGVGTNGQVLIGSTAADPAFSTITSTDGSISFTTGAHTLDMAVVGGSTTIKTITGDTGGAEVPLTGNFNFKGTANQVLITGTANTETVSLIGPYTPATYTAHGLLVGEGTSSIVALGAGLAGQVLQSGGASADPAYSTATYPAVATTSGNILTANGTNWVSSPPATSGTVTSVSGTANQVAVATGTTTPVISLIGPYTPSTYTAHGVLLGEGTSSIVATSIGATNTVLLGNTGADPSFGAVPNAALANSSVTLSNGNNITITGGGPLALGGTASFNLTGTTIHDVQIGNASGSLTSVTNGTTGQVLTAVTGADPTWAAPATSGTVTSVSGTANQVAVATGTTTPVISLIGPYTPATYTAHGVLLGEGTSSIVATAVGTTGQILTGVTGSDPVWAANAAPVPVAGSVTQYDVLVGGASNTIVSVGPGTAGQILQSGGNAANPAYSTATYPATTTVNQILYSSASNVVSGLATANGGVFDTTPSGVPQVDTTNFSVLTTGVQIKGNNTNTAPPAGFIGEQIRSFLPAGSAITLTTATPKTVTSISLTAGIWDVSCVSQFASAATTSVTVFQTSISTTNNALSANFGDDGVALLIAPIVNQAPSFSVPSFRVTLSGTTTYYLVCSSTFTIAGIGVYGRISATRVG